MSESAHTSTPMKPCGKQLSAVWLDPNVEIVKLTKSLENINKRLEGVERRIDTLERWLPCLQILVDEHNKKVERQFPED